MHSFGNFGRRTKLSFSAHGFSPFYSKEEQLTFILHENNLRKKGGGEPESEFACKIREVLRSTFLISNGRTSTWSVVITSHPSSAIPKEQVVKRYYSLKLKKHKDVD